MGIVVEQDQALQPSTSTDFCSMVSMFQGFGGGEVLPERSHGQTCPSDGLEARAIEEQGNRTPSDRVLGSSSRLHVLAAT